MDDGHNTKIYKDSLTGEWFYPQNSYLLSETDSYGVITYANQLFCDVAGYSVEELIGEPHNIVRHPDMPRIAFQGLWDDLKSKGFWTGFVKNKSKDGGFYWVYATVLKKVDSKGNISYLSTRVKPTRENVKKYAKLYAEIKSKE